MVGDCHDRVIAFQCWQFDNEVDGYGLERECFFLRSDKVQQRVVSMCDRLVSLTDGTSFHILPYKLLAMWPPILFKQQLVSFVDSWVCRSWGAMIQLHQISLELRVFWYHQGNAFVIPALFISSQIVFFLPLVHFGHLLFLHLGDYLVKPLHFNSFDKEGLW